MNNLLGLELEFVEKCSLCGETANEPMFRVADRLYHLPGEFVLVSCVSCTLVRLSPRPVLAQLTHYYPEDYYSYQSQPEFDERLSGNSPLWCLRKHVRDSVLGAVGYPMPLARWQLVLQPIFLALFRRRALYSYTGFPDYLHRGRALDIGCGSGVYLSFLKRHGWQVNGIDFSLKAAGAARELYGIEVFAGDLVDAPFEAGSFDYIHMGHIIEHLPDPLNALKKVAGWLKHGGKLYIETPNIDSFGFRRVERYWFPLESPRHLYLFSPRTLQHLVSSAGLHIKQLKTSFFPIYAWEDTYKNEERIGCLLENRPFLRYSRRPRAFALSLMSHMQHLFDRLNGDIISCWAFK